MDPSAYDAVAPLRDGEPVRLRAIRPGDRDALQAGFRMLSERTIYHRFFQAKHDLSDAELTYLTRLDFRDHVGLIVVEPDRDDRIIGVGRFVRLAASPDRAEVAFVVGDHYQGRGVATLLLEHLAGIARELGIRWFDAEVLPGNTQMLEVFQHSGLPMVERAQEGLVHVELALARDPARA